MKKNSLISFICVLFFVVGLVFCGNINAAEAKKQPAKKPKQQPVQKQAANSEKIEDTFKRSISQSSLRYD